MIARLRSFTRFIPFNGKKCFTLRQRKGEEASAANRSSINRELNQQTRWSIQPQRLGVRLGHSHPQTDEDFVKKREIKNPAARNCIVLGTRQHEIEKLMLFKRHCCLLYFVSCCIIDERITWKVLLGIKRFNPPRYWTRIGWIFSFGHIGLWFAAVAKVRLGAVHRGSVSGVRQSRRRRRWRRRRQRFFHDLLSLQLWRWSASFAAALRSFTRTAEGKDRKNWLRQLD